ncbi:MAG: TIM barrel protein [Paracoccus sp. (in: a-proteobacteria)]|nr:TIM barrel protein [Paracoccus sp. (in: a-proteobacteria)]
MPQFAANLTFLFTELPMLDRFAAARDAGFTGAEILFPYDLAAAELRAAAREAGLEMVLMNTPPPNWAGGPRGFAAVPGGEERFRRDFDRALRFSQALNMRHIHVMSGMGSGEDARKTLISNLKWAVRRAPHASLTIEPISEIALPGYYLNNLALAAEIIEAVGSPALGLQFDAFHVQMTEGDVPGSWARYGALVRHVQIAGAPGRNEPARGGPIDFPGFFEAVDASGYRGWIAAEYNPVRTTESGLRWLSEALR